MAKGGSDFDIMDIIDTVGDFLGGGFDAASEALDQMIGAKEVAAASAEAFDEALGMAGTEGQMALLEEIGADGFISAGLDALDSGGDVDLVGLTGHPDAIGEILEEAEGMINEVVESVLEASGDEEA